MDKAVREVALLFGAVHFVCGILVFFEPAVLKVSSLALIATIAGPHTQAAGALLSIAGLLAILGSRRGFGQVARLMLIGPQQFVLVLQIISISNALLAGHFPDGYVPDGRGSFILADQLLVWALSAVHTAMYFAEATRAWGGRGPHV